MWYLNFIYMPWNGKVFSQTLAPNRKILTTALNNIPGDKRKAKVSALQDYRPMQACVWAHTHTHTHLTSASLESYFYFHNMVTLGLLKKNMLKNLSFNTSIKLLIEIILKEVMPKSILKLQQEILHKSATISNAKVTKPHNYYQCM